MTAPVRGPARCFLLGLIVLCPFVARAAGTDIPENGALVLARGGTAASMFGNAYALQFNPAGMATIDGLDVRVDARFVNHAVGFTRDGFDAVSNSGGVYTAPAVEVAYHLKGILGGRLSLGLGVWGPPGVGHYAYPDPGPLEKAAGDSCCADVAAQTPQRYALIDSTILIVYPSIGASWRLSDQLALGVTLQDARTTLDFKQSIAAVSLGGTEDPTYDAIVQLSAVDNFAPTGIVGLAYTPLQSLHIGATFRPQIVVKATGTIGISLPDSAKALGYTTEGKVAKFQFNLPPLARLGATYTVNDRLNVSGEATYEGWHVNQKMVLTPVNVFVKQGNNPAQAIAPIPIEKHWKDSYGGRVGASYTALEWAPQQPMLDVHAGALYETNVVPSAYQSVDFVTGDRVGGSLGLTFHWKGFALTASGMLYRPVSITVTDSKVTRAAAAPENPPVVVGNGTYTSAIWVAAVGLAYTGLGGI